MIWLNQLSSEPNQIRMQLVRAVEVISIENVNIDIEDGLVNGATGILRYIELDLNTNKPKAIYIEFDSDHVGQKARREYTHILNDRVKSNWTPIKPIAREIPMSKSAFFQVFRRQFPLTPAEAITIHKSQGSTCKSVCVSLKLSLSRELLYVALSRVIALASLFLIGLFHATKPSKNDNETMIEIQRLKNEKQLSLSFCTLEIKLGTVVH